MLPLDIIKDSAELRQLIADNPELPIAVIVSKDIIDSDYDWTYTSQVCFYIEDILDCELPFGNGHIFVGDDYEYFLDELDTYLQDYYERDITEEELDKALEEYKPCWKKAIVISVG